jgi:hypothetical protein
MHRGAEHAPPQLALPGLFLCHLTGCASEAYSAANCGSESKRDLLNRSKHCISRPVCHAGTSDRPIRSPTRDVSTTHAAPTSCDVLATRTPRSNRPVRTVAMQRRTAPRPIPNSWRRPKLSPGRPAIARHTPNAMPLIATTISSDVWGHLQRL